MSNESQHIRLARNEDIPELGRIFRETIIHVNRADYDARQIAIWASAADRPGTWGDRLASQYFLVWDSGAGIGGFASMTKQGYLDLMFVSHLHLRKGIASALLFRLIKYAKDIGLASLGTESSITAKPFFEKHGFLVVQENEKEWEGVSFINYFMVVHFN